VKDNATEKSIKASIRYHKQAVINAKEELVAARGRRMIGCGSCEKKSPARLWVLLQKEFYVSPYSCTGGDYWRDGEKDIKCPKCGVWNRCIFKHGKSVAKKYAEAMIENDPYRASDIPDGCDWVNI